jgi:hypothetical protein
VNDGLAKGDIPFALEIQGGWGGGRHLSPDRVLILLFASDES